MTGSLNGAEALVGITLHDRWLVTQRLRNDPGVTGQSRSSCYKAVDTRDDRRSAFVKAFDFKHEEATTDTDSLERMLREYNHERNVHLMCRDDGLSRITQIYDSGKTSVNGHTVHFIVCECARGTLRETHPPGQAGVPAYEVLEGLRDVASALSQLHTARIAHQDVKPSNAVFFEHAFLKLTDLGSSSSTRLPSPPHDDDPMAGQPSYAPYELLYDSIAAKWYERRVGTDFFLLGNLAFTSFVGTSVTIPVLHSIPHAMRRENFKGEYREVMPLLVEAHFELVPQFIEACVPDPIREDLASIVLEMCHPDPDKRGHPRNIAGSGARFGLERYISRFDFLSKRMKTHVTRRVA